MTLNAERLLAHRPADIAVRYTRRDSIFYALSIGIGCDVLDPLQLRFVREGAELAFPTLATALGWMGRLTDPAFGLDNRKVVASDLGVEWLRPLAVEGELTSRPRVRDVFDKGAGQAAIIRMERDLLDADGDLVARVTNSILARGQGGFGGSAAGLEDPEPLPDREPDLVDDLPTPANLALLFSLNGDTNPIHSDPDAARAAGFKRPLLHGAATFGIAAHALLRSVADHRSERFAALHARFARPFFPGDTLRTEMWRQADAGAMWFRCRSVQSGDIVLDHGLLRLRD